VTATSTVDPSKKGTATVTVTTPTPIEIVEAPTVRVWSEGGIYVESSDETIQKIIVYDLSGGVVYNTSYPGTKEVMIENLPRGKVMIIIISLNGGKIERKKIVTK
jgi:hypothetical protein